MLGLNAKESLQENIFEGDWLEGVASIDPELVWYEESS